MLSELRTYTINRGQMDSWARMFADEVQPLIEASGIVVTGPWTDLARERFIWIRSFRDRADMDARRAAFLGSPAWRAMSDRVASHMARQTAVLLQPWLAFDAWREPGSPPPVPRRGLAQLRVYTVNAGCMDRWLELYEANEVPGHAEAGISLEWLSTDTDGTRFVWIRSCDDEADLQRGEEAFHASRYWRAIKDEVPALLARGDVTLMTPAVM